MRTRFLWEVVVGLLTILPALAPAALVDSWRASDLTGLDNGDAVAGWTSTGNRTLASQASVQPIYLKNATPAGGPSVRFNNNWLRIPNNSPVHGLTNFSIALVFKADAVGGNYAGNWYGKTGIVDAEEPSVVPDWGTVVDENGRVGFGVGSPDLSLYSTSAPSVVDGNYHAAVFTWGGGTQAVYLDNRWTNTVTGASILPRDNAGLSFGGIHTGAGDAAERLIGEIVEVQFYDTNLNSVEVTNLLGQLVKTHLVSGQPTIFSFTASASQILIDNPVTLSWNVSNATQIVIDNNVGAQTASNGSVRLYPRTNTTYTLTASNSIGAHSAKVTVLVDQGMPTALAQTVSAAMNQPTVITLAGSDPNGGKLTYSIVSSPLHGTLSGTLPSLIYTPVTNYIGNDQFSFKVNDGEFDSPAAIVSLMVQIPPTPPSAVVLSTTNIIVGAGPGAFIAALFAIDANVNETHTFTLPPAFGANARFAISGNQLLAGQGFAAREGDVFDILVRATDNSGLFVDQVLQLRAIVSTQSIVINEIHYNPPDNTIREDFVELHNPTSASVDISLWSLKDAVKFTFPTGTVIGPAGFLVIAEDPGTIASRYGVTALGPWDGNLSSDGSTVTLQDASQKTVNTVSYSSEFPWPIASDGEGASMALVNASLDNNLGSSWRPETPPSPGRTNAVFAINAAPNIRQVKATPAMPASTDAVLITAKITDPEGVASVQLQYQIVSPGNYLPATLPYTVSQLSASPYEELPAQPNPAYDNPTNWVTVPMADNGSSGDTVAGDDIYSAVVPPQDNRTLVRYRIVVSNTFGASRRAPFEDDPSLNFAYYVYNGVPSYQGVGAAALQALPVYTLISRQADVTTCTAYSTANQLNQYASNGLAHLGRFNFNWPGTMVYDGQVYDNIRYRLHGANGRYQPGKRNWRFAFNKGNYLAAKDQSGRHYPRKWVHLTTGKGSDNRLVLTFSLNESINYFLWNKVGVPAPRTVYFHFRVVQGANEAPDQYNGDFWGLNWAQEDYDGRFLDSHKLPKGNLYKLINTSFSSDPGQDMLGQQRYQAPFAVSDGWDGANIQYQLQAAQSSDWIRANVNLTEWYHYHAICQAVRNFDFWPNANKNAAWYFEPDYNSTNNFHGRMWTLPWDTDCTWGPTWNSGQDLVYGGVFLAASHPDLAIEYANTIREVRDLLIQPDQINPIIEAYAAQFRDFVPADLARWSNAPSANGSYADLTAQSGFVSPALRGLSNYVQDLKDFMFTGGYRTWWIDRQTVAAGGWCKQLDTLAADTRIPNQPTITYLGAANYPVAGLTFRSSAFSPPTGGGTFAAMQWRVAEITPTNAVVTNQAMLKLEWDAVWNSGQLSQFNSTIQIPPTSLQPGKLYRARVRHLDSTGRWSKWSAPTQFTPSLVDVVSVLKTNLVISEIMYHPPALGGVDGDQFEFLELKNVGSITLDLSGLTFTSGITFTFTNGTTLAPGKYFLLGRNAAALEQKYPGVVVNGIYSGKLSNSGDTITLAHPFGVDILSVTYGDRAPFPVTADGFGFSLVPDDTAAGRYRASSHAGGSPGSDDPPSLVPRVVINEILTNPRPPAGDVIELYNPGAADADISGWFLTDDAAAPAKYRFPDGTVLRAGGYTNLLEAQFNAMPGSATSFSLSSLGEQVYLFSATPSGTITGYSHGFSFEGAAVGETYGRCINSVGEEQFPPLARPTLGSANAGPRVGPVVISEIQYSTNSSTGAFVELRNISSKPVPLFDPETPTNTWKLKGLSYTFPQNVSIPVDGYVLLTAMDPTAFRAANKIPDLVQVFGPAGKYLSTNGDLLQLLSPEATNASGVPYFPVDEIRYGVASPWPVAGDQNGLSLQRINPSGYGNDPVNWVAAAGTPGSPLPGGVPLVTLSVAIDPADLAPLIAFSVEAAHGYTVQYKTDLNSPDWVTLIGIPAAPTNGVQSVKDVDQKNARFYRVMAR